MYIKKKKLNYSTQYKIKFIIFNNKESDKQINRKFH